MRVRKRTGQSEGMKNKDSEKGYDWGERSGDDEVRLVQGECSGVE